jgi:hypothetical protein
LTARKLAEEINALGDSIAQAGLILETSQTEKVAELMEI